MSNDKTIKGTVKNTSSGPLPLSSGRVMERLETLKGVDITEHERRAIDAGDLLLLDSRGRDQSSKVKSPDDPDGDAA